MYQLNLLTSQSYFRIINLHSHEKTQRICIFAQLPGNLIKISTGRSSTNKENAPLNLHWITQYYHYQELPIVAVNNLKPIYELVICIMFCLIYWRLSFVGFCIDFCGFAWSWLHGNEGGFLYILWGPYGQCFKIIQLISESNFKRCFRIIRNNALGTIFKHYAIRSFKKIPLG